MVLLRGWEDIQIQTQNRIDMDKKYYINRVKELERQIELAMRAVDKSIGDQKILRGYLDDPYSVAKSAVISRRYYANIDSAYIGGYAQALFDIKKSLGIEQYLSAEEIVSIVDDAMQTVTEQ